MGSTTLLGDLGCTDPPDKYTPNKFTRFYIAARWVDAKKNREAHSHLSLSAAAFSEGCSRG